MAARAQIDALTGIRAIAVVMVLSLHVLQGVPQVTEPMRYAVSGTYGVDLFFILSGYINAYVYFDSLRRPSARSWLLFLWHRLIRIYPAYLAVIAIVMLRSANAGNFWTLPFEELPAFLTMTQTWTQGGLFAWNPPSWSVSAEWFAYLLFPALVPLIARLNTRFAALVLAAACLACGSLALQQLGWNWNVFLGRATLVRVMSEFTCGIFLFRFVALSRDAIPGDWIGMTGLLLLAFAIVTGSAPWYAVPFFLAMIVLGAATATGFFKAMFASRPIVWIGTISYSIYICHTLAFDLTWRIVRQFNFSPYALIALGLAGAVTMGTVLFYLIESPARRVLRRLVAADGNAAASRATGAT